MMYRKNLYSWESLLRIVAGVGLAAYALLIAPAGLLSYSLAAGGAVFALTGVFGWCPMCAMVGRRLPTDSKNA